MTDLLTESLAALERIQRECAAIVPQLKGDGIQDDTAALQSMLDNPDRYGFTDGIVNLSEAIEVPPLTEAITKVTVIPEPECSTKISTKIEDCFSINEDAERAAYRKWLDSIRRDEIFPVQLAELAWLERAARG